jgi:uncharacterized protein with PQ loop repeat
MASEAAREVFTVVLGVLGAGCFALLLGPQVLLNARRKSTDGLSIGLVLLWHVGSLVYGAQLLAARESVWLLVSMGCFCVMSAILEGQHAVYAYRSRVPIVCWGALLTLASGGLIYAGRIPLLALPPALREQLGDGLPALFFGAGFVPQLLTFVRNRSIAGYSFGVTALDIVGSAANCAVLLLEPRPAEGGSSSSFAIAALPFLTIIALHVVLVLLALWIVIAHPTVKPMKGRRVSLGGRAGASPILAPTEPPPPWSAPPLDAPLLG